MSDEILVAKIKCPVCEEGWELVYDDYTDLYHCGGCAGIFKLEE